MAIINKFELPTFEIATLKTEQDRVDKIIELRSKIK